MSIRTRFGRAVILVEDYDKAFEFYEKNFFCHKILDHLTPEGQRQLHVSFPGNEEAGICFLDGKAGNQTGTQPTLLIYTNNIEDLYTHVIENGVRIIRPLEISREYSHFHCADLYGNQLVLLELPGTTS
ncbi:VOC family protein [uncultured Chitinophaga sp.]|uniref:VOC family protein n=1 Tax=uncultured Chitinophaga sp. TaxID=339340 RepID=UPI0025E51FC0|nr:VOC family protein [uncultured Chitinophaga sp.]